MDLDQAHADSVSGDLSGLKGKLIELLRGGAEVISPPASGPGAAAVAGIRSMLPGRGNFSQEFDRYNRAAAPSPMYSHESKFGSVVRAPGSIAPSQGSMERDKAMALQTAMVAAIRQAAFRHRKTGQVHETGAIHDVSELPGLPEKYSQGRMQAINDWEDGFTTDKGKFLNRTQAAEHAGMSHVGELDSAHTPAGKAELARQSANPEEIWAKVGDLASPEAAASKVLRNPSEVIWAPASGHAEVQNKGGEFIVRSGKQILGYYPSEKQAIEVGKYVNTLTPEAAAMATLPAPKGKK